MIEVPSLLFRVAQVLKATDSYRWAPTICCNSFFAADRSNPSVAKRLRYALSCVLNLVRSIAQAASPPAAYPASLLRRDRRPALEAMALVGLGNHIALDAGVQHRSVKIMIRNRTRGN